MNKIIADICDFGGWMYRQFNAFVDFVLEGFDGD